MHLLVLLLLVLVLLLLVLLVEVLVHGGQVDALEVFGLLLLEALWHRSHWRLALAVAHFRWAVVLSRLAVGASNLSNVHGETLDPARTQVLLRQLGWALNFFRLGSRFTYFDGWWHWLGGTGSLVVIRGVLGRAGRLLTLLPLVDFLEDSVLVQLLELPVDCAGFGRVSHNDFVQDELLDDVLVDCVLLKFEIVVVDRLTLNDLVVVLWVI